MMRNAKHKIRTAKQSIADSIHKISDDDIYLGYIGRGDVSKTVLVPNKPGYVYIRIPKKIVAGELQEYSEHIAISKNEYRHNAPVKVVKRKDNPSQFEVKELWIAGMGIASAESIMGSVTNHHWNHELYSRSGGHDPMMIDEAQIKNLQITPTSPPSSSVIIDGGWYIWKDGIVHWHDRSTLDLASSVPSGTNAESYVNIRLDPETDTIYEKINETITLPGFGANIKDLMEWPESDYIPIGCVRLEAGVYQIDWSNGKTPNIMNMRPMHSMMPRDMLPAIHPINPPEGYHSGSLDSIYVREEDPSGTYDYGNLHDILELELGPERARVKVSSDDTTPDFLENKVVAGTGVSMSVLNPGADEQLEVSAGTPSGTIDAYTVELPNITSPVYTDVEDANTLAHSVGLFNPAITYITKVDNTHIDVAAGHGWIRENNNNLSPLIFFQWPASTNILIPTGSGGVDAYRYVGIEYNGGSPQVTLRTSFDWNWQTDFPLGRVSQDGSTLRIFNAYAHTEDTANYTRQYLRAVFPLQREVTPEGTGGLEIADLATRYLTMSAGVIWHGFNRFVIGAIDTSGSDTFDLHYQNGTGGFTHVTSQTQWPNTQYDDGTGTLHTMTAAHYACLWVYLDVSDGTMDVLYGRNDYTLQVDAEAENPPSNVPGHIEAHGRLIGRLIYQKSASSAALVESAWGNAFSPSGAGGGGTPASTVETEQTYGQSSAVGTSTDYARGDHTHGTVDHDSH